MHGCASPDSKTIKVPLLISDLTSAYKIYLVPRIFLCLMVCVGVQFYNQNGHKSVVLKCCQAKEDYVMLIKKMSVR